MTHFTQIDIDQAFVPKDTPMFSDLIARIGEDGGLKSTRRRDMISGLRRVAKAIGRAPQDVPCHGRWLQPRLAKIAPAALGLSIKTWQNAVSNARSAMAQAGIVDHRPFTGMAEALGQRSGHWRQDLAACSVPLCALSEQY